MNYNKLALAKTFGDQTETSVSNTLILALAFTPYIKYKGDDSDVRAYYFGITRLLDDYLNTVNEVRSFDLDNVKRKAWECFQIRYKLGVHPDVDVMLNKENPFKEFQNFVPKELLIGIKRDMANILKNHFANSGE